MADFKKNENKAEQKTDDESAISLPNILAQSVESVEANKVQKAQDVIKYFASKYQCPKYRAKIEKGCRKRVSSKVITLTS